MLHESATFSRSSIVKFTSPLRLSWMATLTFVCLMNVCAVDAANIYDATADFSSINIANSVWSAGYKTTLNSSFVLFDQYAYVANNYTSWNSSAIAGQTPLGTPELYMNISNTMFNGLAPNQIALHPGPSNEFAILRFTAPATASYYLELQFFEGESVLIWGETDGYAILNNNTASPLYYVAATSTNPSFQSNLSLSAGDNVDIVVGSKGNHLYDTTPITVKFTEQAVPEPHSVLLGLIAAGAIATKARQRKG